MKKAKDLLRRMRMGSCEVVGGHVFFTDPSITEAMATFGYDFLWIDGEHGPFDKQNLLMHVLAANEGGSAAFVRVPANDPVIIKPILEMGIDGIIIPMVLTEQETKDAMAACLYPPEGIRGFGPRRAIGYGAMDLQDYLEQAKDSFIRIVQIEHKTAVENIEAILGVTGLDAIIIGPNDLSASLGLLGHSMYPEVLEMGKTVILAAKKAGKPVGVSIGPDQTTIKTWMDMGVDFISVGDDISFLQQGASQTLRFVARQSGKSV